MIQIKQSWLIRVLTPRVLAVLGVGLLVRLAIAAVLHPSGDEAYYYLYSQHLNWSYFDHPPLVAWTTGIGPWITGIVSQLTIRLGTVLLYTLTLLLLYLTGARLFSPRAGFYTLLITTLIPIFQLSFGVFNLPDGPLMLFWAASLLCATWEFFPATGHYQPSARLVLLGLLVGLACLGKYHGFILGLGLVSFCLLSPPHRRVFRSPWLGLSLGCFSLTQLPVLIWNGQHDWVSFRFHSNRVPTQSGYSILGLLSAWLIGIGCLFPSFGLPLWWVSFKATLRQWRSQRWWPQDWQQKYLLLLCLSLPAMVGFTLIGGYRPLVIWWPMPGFWVATLLLGHQAGRWSEKFSQGVRLWLWISGFMTTAFLLIGPLHVSYGIFQTPANLALPGIIPAQQDASTELFDVQQLRQGWQSPPLQAALQQAGFLFTSPYWLGGFVAMAIAPLNPKPITVFNADLRGFAFWSTAEQWVGQDGLYVALEKFESESAVKATYQDYFRSLRRIGDIPIQRNGVVVQRFVIYQAEQLQTPYPRPYGQ